MSWNRYARVLVAGAAVAGALTVAGCAKGTEKPALSGEPNEVSTTTTAPASSSTTSTTVAK
jgi:outer membrane murein-binding lipoprotein Lpp